MKMPATRGMKLSMRGLWFAACLLISTGAWAQTAPVAAQKTQLSGDLGSAICWSVRSWLQETAVVSGCRAAAWTGQSTSGMDLAWRPALRAAMPAALRLGLTSTRSPSPPALATTYTTWTGRADERRLQIFGQGLFGEVYGFDGVYPASKAATSSANSLSIEAGAGVNLLFSKHLGVRLIQAEYVRSALPNNASNIQDDLRLSFGVTYHLGAGAARR